MRIFTVAFAVALAASAAAQEHRAPVPDPEPLVALLRAGNVGELDARMGAYQAAYEKRSDAEWAALGAFAAFERIEPGLEAAFSAWVIARPKSYSALVARGAYFYQRAWTSRGGRFSAETQPERFAAMERHLEAARRDFLASLALSPRPQVSYHYLIGIAMATDAAAARGFYEAALLADPESYASRRAYLNALRPEWGGSVYAMRAFVDETAAAAKTPKQRVVSQYLKASFAGRLGLEAQRSKDYARALQIYTAALADAEDAFVLGHRGQVLLNLSRLDEAARDLDRAIELEPTSSQALENRGNLRERRRRSKDAISDYARAAAHGSSYAIHRLGLLYINGRDVPRDYAAALKWLELGAGIGDDRAQSALGWMYSAGAGVPQDGRRAIALWRLSAAQGNQEAQKYLDNVPWWWRARYAVEEYFEK